MRLISCSSSHRARRTTALLWCRFRRRMVPTAAFGDPHLCSFASIPVFNRRIRCRSLKHPNAGIDSVVAGAYDRAPFTMSPMRLGGTSISAASCRAVAILILIRRVGSETEIQGWFCSSLHRLPVFSFSRVTLHSGAGADGFARAGGEPFRQSLLAECRVQSAECRVQRTAHPLNGRRAKQRHPNPDRPDRQTGGQAVMSDA